MYDSILAKLSAHALLAILLDPEFGTPEEIGQYAANAVEKGADIILVGGSSHVEPQGFFASLKEVQTQLAGRAPVIIYTEDFNMVSDHADAILYGSVLNSQDPHYLVKMPVFSAPLIRKIGLEALNTGFLIFEPGGTVGHVLNCQLLPRSNPKISLAYSIGAELLGSRLVYLEAGSRAAEPLPAELVRLHRKNLSIPIIVGGGVKSPAKAAALVEAGASIVVVGTAVEEGADVEAFATSVHTTAYIKPPVVTQLTN